MEAGTLPLVTEPLAEEAGIETNERGELVLDIDLLRPKPRWLRIDGVEVKIPGELSLDTMLELQGMEQSLGDRRSSNANAIDTIHRFADLLQGIIADANPDLGKIELHLGVIEATRLLVFLAQPDESMAMAFVNALTAGGGEKPDAANSEAHRLARAAGLEPEEKGGENGKAPLRSAKRSSSRSSRSANSTTGRRSGGKTPAARGPRSAPTSRTRSKGSGSGNASK